MPKNYAAAWKMRAKREQVNEREQLAVAAPDELWVARREKEDDACVCAIDEWENSFADLRYQLP